MWNYFKRRPRYPPPMLELDGRPLTLEQIRRVSEGQDQVRTTSSVSERMRLSRAVVEEVLTSERVVYGVNTGFGKLSDVHVPADQVEKLQLNLIRSHACGVGDPLSKSEARALMLLRSNVLATGFSGARPSVLDHLLAMLNADLVPFIPEKGSVGASGDLAPLAHLALAMIGEGQILRGGSWVPAAEALESAGLRPLRLEAKEGLVLVNGTQAIGAVGCLALARASQICDWANIAGALSLDALLGTPAAFDDRIHGARGHAGQIDVAAFVAALLEGSEIRESHRTGDPRVQDAYSLRCIPQVHGAVRDVIRHASDVLEQESGGATDNPLVFCDTGEIISGGNFHGAPLAYALDYAAIALTDLGNICERRIDRLVNPDLNEGLPAFLANNPGMESGLMIPHVVAVALVNECKVLATPASTDNLPTSGGKEDHVSMGMTSALKLRQIVANLEKIVAIELLAAVQGLHFRRPLKTGRRLEPIIESVLNVSAKLVADRPLGSDIENLANYIRQTPIPA